MHGFFDGVISTALALIYLFLTLLFVILKLIGVLVCSWWWVLLPIFLVLLFLIISTLPGAP